MQLSPASGVIPWQLNWLVITFTVIYMPTCFKFMVQMCIIIVTTFLYRTGLCCMSNLGSESSWFTLHGCLVFARQYHVSHLICKNTRAGSQRLLCTSTAFMWLNVWAKILLGCTTEWSFRPIHELFVSLHTHSWPQQASPCLIAVIACWVCTLNCSGMSCDPADTLNSTSSFLALAIASIAS